MTRSLTVRFSIVISATSLILGSSFFHSPASAREFLWGNSDSIVINEVGCDQATGDFIEIRNLDAVHPVSISGWLLTDQPLSKNESGHRYVFPNGSIINAGELITLRSGLNKKLPFGIGCADDSIILARPAFDELIVQDEVAVPNLVGNATWGRLVKSQKSWNPTTPTPGTNNFKIAENTIYDRAAFLYDPFSEHQISLTLPQESRDSLSSADPFVYVPAQFSLVSESGQTFPESGTLTVGVRLKGSVGSYRPFPNDKAGFKIKFDEYVDDQRFFGLKKITLNNMVQDPTMTNQVVTYELFRDMGIMACRTGFAELTVDGVDYGLYLNIEQYDDVSLAWYYPVVTHLYEGKQAIPNPSMPDLLHEGIRDKFPVDEGDKQDISDLENLVADVVSLQPRIQELASANETDFIIPKSVDAVQIAKVMAIEKYISHWDGYSSSPPWTPNNHFLINPNGKGFEILPWGVDQTWTGWWEDPFTGNAALYKLCMVDTTCSASYFSTLALLPGIVEEKDYLSFFNELFETHEISRQNDPLHPFSEEYRSSEIAYKEIYIRDRAIYIEDVVEPYLESRLIWNPDSTEFRYGTPFTSSHLNAIPSVPGKITYSMKVGSRPDLGQVEVTARLVPYDTEYEPTEIKKTFRIWESQLIDAPKFSSRNLSPIEGQNTFDFKVSSSSNLKVKAISLTKSVCVAKNSKITIKSRGICRIQFRQAGNIKYLEAPVVTRKFKVR